MFVVVVRRRFCRVLSPVMFDICQQGVRWRRTMRRFVALSRRFKQPVKISFRNYAHVFVTQQHQQISFDVLSAQMAQCTNGQGVDRHLLGLKVRCSFVRSLRFVFVCLFVRLCNAIGAVLFSMRLRGVIDVRFVAAFDSQIGRSILRSWSPSSCAKLCPRSCRPTHANARSHSNSPRRRYLFFVLFLFCSLSLWNQFFWELLIIKTTTTQVHFPAYTGGFSAVTQV